MTPATIQKREKLAEFTERVLEPEPAVQGVVAIGSLASGMARPDSDIDAAIFLDPCDLYIVPAEFKWNPSNGSFHSIFSRQTGLEEAIEFDFMRLDLNQWSDPAFEWPEGHRAALAEGWLAFDRYGQVARLIAERTAYDERLRLSRLDEAITWLDQHLSGSGPQTCWENLGAAAAYDRLQAAYDYLAQGLLAYNRRWRPWRNRQMSSLLHLSWLPDHFASQATLALNAPSQDFQGYLARVEALRSLFNDLLDVLMTEGTYGKDPISEAFMRSHEEPGRAWNMDAWNTLHRGRSSKSAHSP